MIVISQWHKFYKKIMLNIYINQYLMNTDKINFQPTIWGGAAWKFLHTVALAYPANPTAAHKSDYRNFFLSIGNVLPCETCSGNFQEHIKKHNIDNYLGHPHDLFEWTVLIRNEVQIKLGKPLLNAETIRESFYNENEKANNPSLLTTTNLVILALVVLAGIYIYKNQKK